METNKYDSMFMTKLTLWDQGGKCRKLPLNELFAAHTALARKKRDNVMFPVFKNDGAVTRSQAERYNKEEAERTMKIGMFMPSIQKHLEALPLMLAEAEKQDAGADALWTMQCHSGCPIAKNNFECLFTHLQTFVCHPPPHGSPCSD